MRNVARQAPAPGDDGQPVEVEERKAGAAHGFDGEARLLEEIGKVLRSEMASMADVAVEGGDRPARDGHDETAAGSEVRLDGAQESVGVVDVLEHLGADCVRGPAPVAGLDLGLD
jgi:hypothetical protein